MKSNTSSLLPALILTLAAVPIAGRAQTAPTYTVLHKFTAVNSDGINSDGAAPFAPLILGSDGDFYGTTSSGGAGAGGTAFKITAAGTFGVLHAFGTDTNASGDNVDGKSPQAALVEARDGDFYGTAADGGLHDAGVVFKLGSGGALTAIYAFKNGNDGGFPDVPLVQGSNGNFYTTSDAGGTDGQGSIQEFTPAGALTTLSSFDYAFDGAPAAGLILATDGDFYGTTALGGAHGEGTVFKVTTAGKLTTLHQFSTPNNGINSDGAEPVAPMLEGRDGDFYSTTESGGEHGNGAIFKITSAGVFTTLHSFADTDGSEPIAGLIEGKDGYFYGTTLQGGQHGEGTIFRMTPAGTVTVLYSFGAVNSSDFNSGGALPYAGLVQDSDGSFYGTTRVGGPTGNGVIYKLAVPPTITSAATATATVGKAFSYQITATNNPTSYGVGGLFNGISVNQKTGLISGTPTGAGTHTLTLRATNGAGTGSETLTLTVKAALPAITSAKTATATVGKAFSYQITATNNPTSYGVGGLFNGISVNQKTGLISGTPTGAGTHTLTLRATNGAGTGSETLTLTVKSS